ncbi:hypothetical protein GCM10020331_022070 [Ectobacillus funiculus]
MNDTALVLGAAIDKEEGKKNIKLTVQVLVPRAGGAVVKWEEEQEQEQEQEVQALRFW